MEHKINIAELLKDCPSGMELYSPIFGEVYLEKIRPHLSIIVATDKEQGDFKEEFLYDGRYGINGECMLFPSKGKTTWEGFIPPCKFKDGDIITDSLGTCIFKGESEFEGCVNYYCGISNGYFIIKDDKCDPCSHYGFIVNYRLSTEEEKQQLFDAIKGNGYKWNAKTKTLEKLVQPKFKDGDIVSATMHPEGTWVGIFKQYKKTCFESYCSLNTIGEFRNIGYKNHSLKGTHLATEEEKQKLFDAIKANGYKWNAETKTLEKLIEPKFKVGDRVRLKSKPNYIYTIHCLTWDDNKKLAYKLLPKNDKHLILVSLNKQDNYELVTNKFDITTLIPFESRVLVRDGYSEKWKSSFWGFYDSDHAMNYPYECCGNSFAQCIPYEQNEHLLGKKDDCDEYYKTWE